MNATKTTHLARLAALLQECGYTPTPPLKLLSGKPEPLDVRARRLGAAQLAFEHWVIDMAEISNEDPDARWELNAIFWEAPENAAAAEAAARKMWAEARADVLSICSRAARTLKSAAKT
ncbi:MAG: hypothetical protein RBR77_04245 [Thauera sp.]|jgi:hypothetical protein|nr:hypothetical protein [Thauera sp.]